MEATENALQHETHWYFFLFPGERVKTVSDCRFLDRLQKGLGEVQVRVGSTGVVTQVESLKKGRYTFGIWFGAGKNNESYAEYDPEIHGAVIESHPKARRFAFILDSDDEVSFAECREDCPFLVERRIELDPTVARRIEKLDRDAKVAAEEEIERDIGS